ncbi:uncharacterized protein LOC130744042 [Lotus japonicus]|uniref:uncharacterized protein LOC130744042 n=1 Tax=Lotus japonicus TaxID=34305 RepID=UPI0025907753|nr:uncharacterized protein LOC130744042 [Lotus japonicus]
MDLPVEMILADFSSPEGWYIDPHTGICTYVGMSTFWYRHPDSPVPGYPVSFPRMFSFIMPPHFLAQEILEEPPLPPMPNFAAPLAAVPPPREPQPDMPVENGHVKELHFRKMDNDMAEALRQLTNFLANQAARAEQQNQPAEDDVYKGIDKFLKRNPPLFDGGYDPEGANRWLRKIEQIYESLPTSEDRMIAYASYLFHEEARNWWVHAKSRITPPDGVLTWSIFKEAFLEKYFPADVKGKKETEFLELKQGEMFVGQYAARFEELSQFHPYYGTTADDASKCIRFECGLRPDIRAAIGHQQIRTFTVLVEKCRIFEENDRARREYYKSSKFNKTSKRREERKKPYSPRNYKPELQNRNYGGARPTNPNSHVTCYRCGKEGHKSWSCTATTTSGQTNLKPPVVGGTNTTSAPRNSAGASAQKPGRPVNKGKVFAMTGAEANTSEDLIQGTCFLCDISLVVLYDSGATHSFISHERAKSLKLVITQLPYDLVVTTPTKESAVTSSV